MSRHLVAASVQSLTTASSPVAGMPYTVACWCKPTTQTAAAIRALLGLRNAAGAVAYFSLAISGGVTAGLFDGTINDATAVTAALVTAGAWQHVCAVYAGLNSRSAYLNGANKVTSLVATSPWTPDQIDLGRYVGPGNYYDGDVAEAAIWNVPLSDADVALLATGVYPATVQPGSCVDYWPLIGTTAPEPDSVGSRPLTVNGATLGSTHPPMIGAAVNTGAMFTVF